MAKPKSVVLIFIKAWGVENITEKTLGKEASATKVTDDMERFLNSN